MSWKSSPPINVRMVFDMDSMHLRPITSHFKTFHGNNIPYFSLQRNKSSRFTIIGEKTE